jgi:serine protease Do
MNALSKRLFTIVAIVILILSAACGSGEKKTAEPQATAVSAATEVKAATAVPAPTNTSAPEVPAGLVTTLDAVKDATIQIEAQGTFQDPQVGLVVNGAGRGSGFIIDPSGIAVTNNHVVTGAALLKVWVGGNKEKVYNARVLGVSECSDLAVIKIDGADFPYLDWYDGSPKVGLEIYAAGYPLGDPEFTLTKGIVSKANADGKTSWASVGSVLEHDARINPGNSGGPLVDPSGSVVGVNYANNNSNQYFAISRAEVDLILSELKGGKDVNSIGVNGQVVMSDDQTLSGIWVSSVKSGSPADKSGVESGDIITEIEGLVLGTDGTMSDYCQILRSHQPGDTLSLTVLRWQTQEILEGQLNGRELAVTATYGDSQPTETADQGGSGDGSTAIVADDSDVIAMEAPVDWEYDGSPWESTWSIGSGTYDFVAQTLTVSPDVNAYSSGWDTIGIFVATSQDWGSLGGYANLMEGVQVFYSDCQPNGNRKYDDGTYEGQMQMYKNCGSARANALVLTVRPKVNAQSYLLLVELKYFTDDEFNLLDAMYTSMAVVP